MEAIGGIHRVTPHFIKPSAAPHPRGQFGPARRTESQRVRVSAEANANLLLSTAKKKQQKKKKSGTAGEWSGEGSGPVGTRNPIARNVTASCVAPVGRLLFQAALTVARA